MHGTLLLASILGCGALPQDAVFDTGLDHVPQGVQVFEERVVELVNAEREAGAGCGLDVYPPVGPLEMDPVLRTVARNHSADMAERDFFDHVNPDGDGPFERMEAASFGGTLPWGENVAAGQPNPEIVVTDWMASVDHCTNIMEPGFGVIGVGYHEDPEGGLTHFWTQVFAGSH